MAAQLLRNGSTMCASWRVLQPFVADDRGQDLIEYALLASIIGIAGVLTIPSITAKMGTNFSNWGVNVQAIWIPNDPQ